MQMRSALIAVLVACGAFFAAAAQGAAQNFPSKAVRIVVPYPAGGSVDIVTRAVSQRLGALWAETIVVENKAGGGTQIGAEAVAKSPADGTTLFATGMETFAITPFVRRLSLRLGWIDQPSDRKVHPNPTPTAGGNCSRPGRGRCTTSPGPATWC